MLKSTLKSLALLTLIAPLPTFATVIWDGAGKIRCEVTCTTPHDNGNGTKTIGGHSANCASATACGVFAVSTCGVNNYLVTYYDPTALNDDYHTVNAASYSEAVSLEVPSVQAYVDILEAEEPTE